jgi:hypothetical protein
VLTGRRTGLEKTLSMVSAQQRSGKVDEEQVRHAMADPEIRVRVSRGEAGEWGDGVADLARRA